VGEVRRDCILMYGWTLTKQKKKTLLLIANKLLSLSLSVRQVLFTSPGGQRTFESRKLGSPPLNPTPSTLNPAPYTPGKLARRLTWTPSRTRRLPPARRRHSLPLASQRVRGLLYS